MNLITPYEVKKYSPAGNDYPTATFCELIPQIEEEFARECLGQDLYDYMVENLADVPTGVPLYSSSATYSIGDIVQRNECLYVSQVAGTAGDPLADNGDWELWDRFTDDDVNIFWKKYVRRILALKVYMASLPYTTWRAGAGGVVIAMGDGFSGGAGFRAANKGEMIDTKNSLIMEIERTITNMKKWLNHGTNRADAGFPAVENCAADMCETKGRRVRRWALKY